MNIDPSIFKAYDIRGIYPEQLDEQAAYLIGRGLVQYFKENNLISPGQKFLVARDTRNSSPVLAAKLIEGITDEGLDVDDLGVASTDVFLFAAGFGNYYGGVMVTASHNPPEYNGFKVISRGVEFVFDKQLQELKETMKNLTAFANHQKGQVAQAEVTQEFLEWLKQKGRMEKLTKKFKIIADPGNGTAAEFIQEFFKMIPVVVAYINLEENGDFPGRGPNSAKNNPVMSEKIIEMGADLGVAWDGDGDRVAFYDEKGQLLAGDVTAMLIVSQVLKENPGSTIVYDLISSKSLPGLIEKLGGKPIKSRVGRAFINRVTQENDGLLGTELSGHYLYRTDFEQFRSYIENTWYTLSNVLHLLQDDGRPLSVIAESLTKYHKGDVVIFHTDKSVRIFDELKLKYPDGNQDMLDGLTVDYGNWWFN